MLRLLLILLVFAFPLMAQESTPDPDPIRADFELTVQGGINDVVVAPWGRLSVRVRKGMPAAFVGRVTVEVSEYAGGGRRRGPVVGVTQVVLHADVNLEEGPATRTLEFDVPAFAGSVNVTVKLERQITGQFYEPVTSEQWSAPTLGGGAQMVAFISKSRLAAAQGYFFFQAFELPYQHVPTSWKPLSGLSAIVLNDDRLSREQYSALIDYLTAGGTIILSPTAASSFNPETLAGRLLEIPATTTPGQRQLSDYAFLMDPLIESGFGAARMGQGFPGEMQPGEMPPGESQPREPGTETSEPGPGSPIAEGKYLPPLPNAGASIVVWKDGGRARPLPGFEGLASIARVGAGNLVLIHTDISREPMASENAPTHPCVQLLARLFQETARRSSQSPAAWFMDGELRDRVDIAGRRIPGRGLMVFVLLGYVVLAGVGMFLLARKLKRPELYPAALLVAALISVGLVFSLGAVFKRTGDRVQAVRVVVSDETTDRNAVFTLGCSYVVDGNSYRFTTPERAGHLPLSSTRDTYGSAFGPMSYVATQQGGDLNQELSGLDRWQNVFFNQRSPGAVEGLRVNVRSFAGGIEVQNLSPHALQGCVMVIGGATPEWHYVAAIGAAGSGDDKPTFSQSTSAPPSVAALADRLSEDVGDDFALQVLLQLFNLDPTNDLLVAKTYAEIASALNAMGVMPGEGEFLLVALLPEDALDKAGLGARDVDPDDIRQANLWMIRGGVENR